MFEYNTTVMTPVFPYVTFTCMNQNKTFCIHRDRVVHTETYEDKDTGQMETDKTFVNFKKPDSSNGNKLLFATVDMPVEVFRDTVLRPAYEGDRNEAS